MTDHYPHGLGLDESIDVGSPREEPEALASAVLGCMRDRPLAVYCGDDRSLKCVPARALGEIDIDDIVGVYSPKARRDEIAEDIRAYVDARFGLATVAPSGSRGAVHGVPCAA